MVFLYGDIKIKSEILKAIDVKREDLGELGDASGHVAIMISPTKSIYAGDYKIKTSDFGYNKSHYENYPNNNGYVYRRYIGLPAVNAIQTNTNNYYRQYP